MLSGSVSYLVTLVESNGHDIGDATCSKKILDQTFYKRLKHRGEYPTWRLKIISLSCVIPHGLAVQLSTILLSKTAKVFFKDIIKGIIGGLAKGWDYIYVNKLLTLIKVKLQSNLNWVKVQLLLYIYLNEIIVETLNLCEFETALPALNNN